MENKEVVYAALRACKTRKDVDDTLGRFDVKDTKDAIDYLNKSMYDPQTFNSSKPISLEDELEFTKQIFLTGTWRLNEYYDLMRIGTVSANA